MIKDVLLTEVSVKKRDSLRVLWDLWYFPPSDKSIKAAMEDAELEKSIAICQGVTISPRRMKLHDDTATQQKK